MGQANTSGAKVKQLGQEVLDEYLWAELVAATPAEREEFRQQEGLPKNYFKELKKRKDDDRRKHEDEERKREDEERKRTVPYLKYKAEVNALEDCIENILKLLDERVALGGGRWGMGDCCAKVKRVYDYIIDTCPPPEIKSWIEAQEAIEKTRTQQQDDGDGNEDKDEEEEEEEEELPQQYTDEQGFIVRHGGRAVTAAQRKRAYEQWRQEAAKVAARK